MLTQSNAIAVEVGYKFTGMVFQSNTPVLGQGPFTPSTPVVGRFVYETNSSFTHDLGDEQSKGYRQQIFNGFSMKIGGVSFRADDYVVAVFNNEVHNNGADLLTIIFSSGLNPAPAKPIDAGGTLYTTGAMNLTLKNNSGTAFSEPALPSEVPIGAFGGKAAFVRDAPEIPSNEIGIAITGVTKISAVTGDFDFDNDVDGADFLVWQRNYGSSIELAADADHDGSVDGDDLQLWESHFGDGASVATAIPEPSALNLLMSATALASVRCMLRHRRE